jgi:hypothetical protein
MTKTEILPETNIELAAHLRKLHCMYSLPDVPLLIGYFIPKVSSFIEEEFHVLGEISGMVNLVFIAC